MCVKYKILNNIMHFLYRLLISYLILSIIGVVSGSNFSIPFFPNEFDVSNDSDVKLELQKNKHDFNDAWQIIDLSDRTQSVPSLVTADPKTEGESKIYKKQINKKNNLLINNI